MVLPIFGTSNQHAIWQPDPDGRGTSSLLQTCLITIGLCIYSAIHLNIPRHGASWWEKFFAKLKWVVVALFAPELVVFTAWCQRQDAKVMLKALVGAHGGRVRPPLYKRLWRWLRKGNRKVKYSTMVSPASVRDSLSNRNPDRNHPQPKVSITVQRGLASRIVSYHIRSIHNWLYP